MSLDHIDPRCMDEALKQAVGQVMDLLCISSFIRGQVVKRHKCTTGTSVYRRLYLAHKRNLRGSVRIRLLIRPSGFSMDCRIVRGVLADFQTPGLPAYHLARHLDLQLHS